MEHTHLISHFWLCAQSRTIWTLKVKRRWCMFHEIVMQFMQNVRMHLRTNRIRFNSTKFYKRNWNELRQNELEIWSKNRQWQSTVSQLRGAHMSITIYTSPWIIWILQCAVLSNEYRSFFFFWIFPSADSWSNDFVFSNELVDCACRAHWKWVCGQHALRPDKIEYYWNSIIFVVSHWVWCHLLP